MIYLWSDFIENGAKWLTENEILNFAISQGIIDISSVQEKIEMTKREELLKKHIYKIWQSKDKNWYTYLPDEVKGRVQRKRKSQEEIEQVVIDYWKTEEENPTIDQVFNEWNDRKLELQQIGRATYIRNQQFYNRHYQKFGKRRIKGVSEDEFSDFLEAQIPEHKLKAKAFSGLKTITRGFLKRAKKKKYITFHVEAMLDDLDISEQSFEKSNKSSEDRAFTEKEFPRLLHYLCSNINVHNLGILLMCITGMRVGDDDDKIRLNQRKPSKYKGLSRFGPEKNLQRINKFMKERPIFYKNLIQMKENFRFYLRCFYCITKVVILQFNSENRTELARNG